MDGYSVKDAAVVLGIPERRVWELLARGVLAGAPEGPDGMIVYLQGRGAAASVAPSTGAAGAAGESSGARTNGNGGSHELSPFRELLTEFRNLTERYGQALLALGEARGEVAALRGRVELLEARMDLRLPSTPPTATVAWEMPEFSDEGAAASAFEAEMSIAHDAAPPDFDEAVAGEDEPAAEPMIDLVEEAIIAEELLADDEQIAEPDVEEVAAMDAAAHESVIADVSMGEAASEAEPEVVAADVEAAEPEPEIMAAPQPEPMAGAIPPEPQAAAEEPPEAPRRRARGGRTATAAFAAALARADDPTIAELPGAEDTAAALAALQRDIDASRAAEPEEAGEPEAAAEPEAIAEPEASAEPAVTEEEAAAAALDEVPAPEVSAATETPEPPEPSVPSYYSTDVVEPDWFADGDFSWLEAAQAEAMRVEAERSREREAPPEPAAGVVGATADEPAESVDEPPAMPDEPVAAAPMAEEPVAAGPMAEEPVAEEPTADGTVAEEPLAQAELPDPEPEPATPSDEPHAEGGDLHALPIEMSDEATGVAADVAFGEHPDADATAPDVGHDHFAPTVESQALAEEEARTAIQDAFEEAPGGQDEESPLAVGTAVAVATAVAEPAAELEVEAAEELADDIADEAPAMAGEPEAEASQEALEAPEQSAGEHVDAEYDVDHEAEVEAEAIQEAFEEPMPAPDWSAAEPVATSTVVEPPTIEDAPSASDDSPRTTAEAAATFPGMEEFIAPSAPPAPVRISADPVRSAGTQPAPAPGEEPLMWLGEEFEEADLEVAAQGWRSSDAAPAGPAGSTPVLELSDAELAQLAEDEGWDADEVEAIRRLLGRPSDAPPPEPFSPAGDLERDADSGASPSSSEQAGPMGGPAAPPASAASQPGVADSSGTPQSWSARPPGNPSGTGDGGESIDSDWLQGRSGAAADAYRRLRKLFPN